MPGVTGPLDLEGKSSEARIQHAIHAAVGALPGVRLWRQNAGKVRVCKMHRECPHCYWMQLAPNGAADLSGLLYDGRRLELEVKTLVGRQRDTQTKWETMIRKFGGVYILSRSPEDALEQVRREL